MFEVMANRAGAIEATLSMMEDVDDDASNGARFETNSSGN